MTFPFFLPIIGHGLVERDDGQCESQLAKAASRARQALWYSYNITSKFRIFHLPRFPSSPFSHPPVRRGMNAQKEAK